MSYVFVNFQQITFKIGTFSNLKALFLAKLTDFPQLVHHKSGKQNVERSTAFSTAPASIP